MIFIVINNSEMQQQSKTVVHLQQQQPNTVLLLRQQSHAVLLLQQQPHTVPDLQQHNIHGTTFTAAKHIHKNSGFISGFSDHHL